MRKVSDRKQRRAAKDHEQLVKHQMDMIEAQSVFRVKPLTRAVKQAINVMARQK